MSKYRNKRTWYLDGKFIEHRPKDKAFMKMMKAKGGILFDSRAEARWYPSLLMLQKSGEIAKLELQPRYKFFINEKYTGIFYKGDYGFFEGDNEICMDVKGVETPVFKLKKKLMKAFYPDVELRIV